jgi:hypothetical protein
MGMAGGERPESKARGGEGAKVARAIGRALWQHEFEKAHPEADPKAKREAWAANRVEYTKAGRRVRMKLERAGFKITAPAG